MSKWSHLVNLKSVILQVFMKLCCYEHLTHSQILFQEKILENKERCSELSTLFPSTLPRHTGNKSSKRLPASSDSYIPPELTGRKPGEGLPIGVTTQALRPDYVGEAEATPRPEFPNWERGVGPAALFVCGCVLMGPANLHTWLLIWKWVNKEVLTPI